MRYEVIRTWPRSDAVIFLHTRCVALARSVDECSARLQHIHPASPLAQQIAPARLYFFACYQIENERLLRAANPVTRN